MPRMDIEELIRELKIELLALANTRRMLIWMCTQ